LGMDFDVAGGNFGVPEKLHNPVAGGDLVFLRRLTRKAQAENRGRGIELADPCAEGALGIFSDQVEDTGQAGVVLRVEVNAESARQKNGICQLKLALLHVTNQLVDDSLAAQHSSLPGIPLFCDSYGGMDASEWRRFHPRGPLIKFHPKPAGCAKCYFSR